MDIHIMFLLLLEVLLYQLAVLQLNTSLLLVGVEEVRMYPAAI
jgi:hypothetical protein